MKIIKSYVIIDNDTFEPMLEVTVQLPMILLSKGTFDYIGNKDAAAFIIGEDFLNAYEKYELGSKSIEKSQFRRFLLSGGDKNQQLSF